MALEIPNDVAAERELLTACFRGGSSSISKGEIVTEVITTLSPEQFAHPHYRKIMVALMEVVRDTNTSNVEWGDVRGCITQESQARKSLTQLISDQELPPISKTWVKKRVERVQNMAKARSINYVIEQVRMKALAGESDRAYDELLEGIFSIGRDKFTTGAKPLTDFLPEIHTEITERRKNDGIVGLETGLAPFDEGTGGLQRKHLYYVGGRPGSMKSVVCGQVACNVAKNGNKVVLASPEMSAEQYTMRLACRMAGIDYGDYNRGRYDEKQEALLHAAVNDLSHENIIINEGGLQSTATLRQDIMQFQPDLLVIDYSQLFDPSRPKNSEYADVTMFSKELNSLKKDFGIAILAAIQLSRKVEERDDKRPIKSDVRSSGQIEQDADVIYMLYREKEYATKDELGIYRMEKKDEEGKKRVVEIDPNKLEWVAAKNRHMNPEDYVTYTKDGELWLYNN